MNFFNSILPKNLEIDSWSSFFYFLESHKFKLSVRKYFRSEAPLAAAGCNVNVACFRQGASLAAFNAARQRGWQFGRRYELTINLSKLPLRLPSQIATSRSHRECPRASEFLFSSSSGFYIKNNSKFEKIYWPANIFHETWRFYHIEFNKLIKNV